MPRMTAQQIQHVNGWSEPPDQELMDLLAQFSEEELETGVVKFRVRPTVTTPMNRAFTIPEQLAAALAGKETSQHAPLELSTATPHTTK